MDADNKLAYVNIVEVDAQFGDGLVLAGEYSVNVPVKGSQSVMAF